MKKAIRNTKCTMSIETRLMQRLALYVDRVEKYRQTPASFKSLASSKNGCGYHSCTSTSASPRFAAKRNSAGISETASLCMTVTTLRTAWLHPPGQDTHRHTQTHTQTHTQSHTQTSHRHTQKHTDTKTHADTQRHAQTVTQTCIHTQAHTDTHRHTDRSDSQTGQPPRHVSLPERSASQTHMTSHVTCDVTCHLT